MVWGDDELQRSVCKTKKEGKFRKRKFIREEEGDHHYRNYLKNGNNDPKKLKKQKNPFTHKFSSLRRDGKTGFMNWLKLNDGMGYIRYAIHGDCTGYRGE